MAKEYNVFSELIIFFSASIHTVVSFYISIKTDHGKNITNNKYAIISTENNICSPGTSA